jgi:hypothetical protein
VGTPPITRDEEADRHWATVSVQTQLAHDHRGSHRTAGGRTARVRIGLALVRAGLAIAPPAAADTDDHLTLG